VADTPAPVEKIMSLGSAEFERSLHVLDPAAKLNVDGRVTLQHPPGQVELTFEHLPSQTLGGLLALPRARITLDFTGLAQNDADAFLQKFDRAFQRGGG